jgi:long-chain acyl-CoA synthetase
MDANRIFERREGCSSRNFREFVDTVSDKFGPEPLFLEKRGNSDSYTVWTYHDFRTEVYRTAGFLLGQGLKKGDTVGLLSENRPEWGFAYFAAVMLGIVIVPLDALLDAESASNNLKASNAKVLFYSGKQEPKLAKIRELTGIELFVCFDLPEDKASVPFEGLKDSTIEFALPAADSVQPDDTASIIFTSGTTGIAKGIQLSQGGILANADAAVRALAPRTEDVFLSVLPLHHTYATTCTLLGPMIAGASVVYPEKIVSTVIVRHLKEAKVSFLIGVPILFDKRHRVGDSETAKGPRSHSRGPSHTRAPRIEDWRPLRQAPPGLRQGKGRPRIGEAHRFRGRSPRLGYR